MNISVSLAFCILLMAGCTYNHAGTPPAAAQVIGSSVQCSHSTRQQTVVRINNKQQLQKIFRQLHGSVIPAPDIQPPEIDFKQWNVLFISTGRQPTAGFRLTLAEPAFTTQHDKALLNVIANKPPADVMVAAVITKPCILVKIPAGNYTTIDVHGLDRVHQITIKKTFRGQIE